MGYTEEQIKQAELNLKGYAPIIKEYSGFIVLANTMLDYRGKCSRILRGDRKGFYTIKRALEMGSSEKSNCNIHGVVFSEAELSCATCKHEEKMPLYICCDCVNYAKYEPAT